MPVSVTFLWREKAPGATRDGWRSLLLPTAACSEEVTLRRFEGMWSFPWLPERLSLPLSLLPELCCVGEEAMATQAGGNTADAL